MVSVALCTYNGGKFLREQLESLRSQTLVPHELQVGDDRSTDDTLEIIEEFRAHAPFPIHVTVNERRLGYGENFIRTARRCSGKWIAFCDQDDIWRPHKLARCASEIRQGVTLIAHSADVMGHGRLPAFDVERVNPSLSLQPRWFCLGFCQVFDSEILRFQRHKLPWAAVQDAHDVWIAFIAGMMGTIVWLGEPLATYRRHDTNLSNDLPELTGDPIDYVVEASRIAGALGFMHASAHYARFAERLSKRAELNERRSLGSFFQLLFSGAYKSGSYEYFGKRGLITDLRTLMGVS